MLSLSNISRRIDKYVYTQLHQLEKEFLQNIHTYDLNILVNKYIELSQIIENIKSTLEDTLEEFKKRLREKFVDELITRSDNISLKDLIKYSVNAGVLKDVLNKLPMDRVVESLPSLDLNELKTILEHVNYRYTYETLDQEKNRKLKENVFHLILSKFDTASCKEISATYYSIRHIQPLDEHFDPLTTIEIIFNSIYKRIDCPNVIDTILTDVIYVFKEEHYKDRVKRLFEKLINNAIENFNKYPCLKHLELLQYLDKYRYYHFILTKYFSEFSVYYKAYANKIIEEFDKCNVNDIEEIFTSRKINIDILIYWGDRDLFIEKLNTITIKYLDKLKPIVISKLINKWIDYTIIENNLMNFMNRVKSVIHEIIISPTPDLDNLSILTSFFSKFSKCDERIIEKTREELSVLCSDLSRIIYLLIDKVTKPVDTIEFANSYYWLMRLKNEVTDKWCSYKINIPEIDFEKIAEIVKKDLEKGLDPYKMRDAILRLYKIDEEFAKRLENRFNRYRLKLGIKFDLTKLTRRDYIEDF